MYDAMLELLAIVILLRLAHEGPPVQQLLPFWTVSVLELDSIHDVPWFVIMIILNDFSCCFHCFVKGVDKRKLMTFYPSTTFFFSGFEVLTQPSDIDSGLLVVQQIVCARQASGLPLQSLPSFKGDLENAWLQHLLPHPFLESQLQAARFLLLTRMQTYRTNMLEDLVDDAADGVSLFGCSDLSSDDNALQSPQLLRI